MKTAGIRRPALLLLAVTVAILSLGVAFPTGGEGDKGLGAPAAPPAHHPEEHTESPPTLKPAAGSKTSNSKSGGSVPASGSHVDGAPVFKPEEHTESPPPLKPAPGSNPSNPSKSGESAPALGSRGDEAPVFKPEEHTERPLPAKPAAESNPSNPKSGESALAAETRGDCSKLDHTHNPLNRKPEDHTGVHPRHGYVGGLNPLDGKLGHVTWAPGSRGDGSKLDHTDYPLNLKPEDHTGVRPGEGLVRGANRHLGSEDHTYKTPEAHTESANTEGQKAPNRHEREAGRPEPGQHGGILARDHTEGPLSHEEHTGKPWNHQLPKEAEHQPSGRHGREAGRPESGQHGGKLARDHTEGPLSHEEHTGKPWNHQLPKKAEHQPSGRHGREAGRAESGQHDGKLTRDHTEGPLSHEEHTGKPWNHQLPKEAEQPPSGAFDGRRPK